jgi:GH18 family chitinase
MEDLRDAVHSVGNKFILVIGGYGISTQEFAVIGASSTARKAFAKNVRKFLVEEDIDGVDIDWEFPNGKTGYENFRKMIEALKDELTTLGKTVSIAINPDYVDVMNSSFLNSADFVNVMTYDLTGQDHSPSNAKDWMKALVSKGAKKEKLTFGVPFYGKSSGGFGTVALQYRDLYAEGKMDNDENTTSFTGKIGTENFTNFKMYYNGPDRIYDKTKWARDNDYGGIMIWDINQDIDFDKSGSLLRAVAKANGTL